MNHMRSGRDCDHNRLARRRRANHPARPRKFLVNKGLEQRRRQSKGQYLALGRERRRTSSGMSRSSATRRRRSTNSSTSVWRPFKRCWSRNSMRGTDDRPLRFQLAHSAGVGDLVEGFRPAKLANEVRFRNALHATTPNEFEKLAAIILKVLGCKDVFFTPSSHDQGVDAFGYQDLVAPTSYGTTHGLTWIAQTGMRQISNSGRRPGRTRDCGVLRPRPYHEWAQLYICWMSHDMLDAGYCCDMILPK